MGDPECRRSANLPGGCQSARSMLCLFDRVGGGITPAVLPHHPPCGSATGGSCQLSRRKSAAASLVSCSVPSSIRFAPLAPSELPAPEVARRSPYQYGTSATYAARLRRDFPLLTGAALRCTCAQLLWPLLTSGDPSQHLSMSVALQQIVRSPRVLRTHLPAYACRIYVTASRARIGLYR